MDYIKQANVCYKCLQKSHESQECKAKLRCYYCQQAGKKNIEHNAALCTQLGNTEIASIIDTRYIKNKEKTCQSKGNDDSTSSDILREEPVIVEDKVFATYSDFM